MELVRIVRKEFTAKFTRGEILSDGSLLGFTLEDVVRPYGVYIKERTAAPYGRYELVITYSNRFRRPMPLIINLQSSDPLFNGIRLFGGRPVDICGLRIHGGNTEENTEGCPLVGAEKTDSGIRNSAKVYGPFFKELKASLKIRKVYLEIGRIGPSGDFVIPIE